jgi:hypothetical protein
VSPRGGVQCCVGDAGLCCGVDTRFRAAAIDEIAPVGGGATPVWPADGPALFPVLDIAPIRLDVAAALVAGRRVIPVEFDVVERVAAGEGVAVLGERVGPSAWSPSAAS